MQHNTLPKHNQKLPFTRYDFGWVLLCIGMAIGAGTVLMPVQIGLKGIWVFITAAIIAYPATWVVQDIYLKTLSESDSCNDYTDIISHYLGKNWGIFLGVIYFLMIIHGIFIYSLSVVFDSASYLKTFGLTDADLSQSLLYKVAIFAVLVAIRFCDDPALEFRQYNRLPASLRLLPRRPAYYSFLLLFCGIYSGAKPDEYCLPQTGSG